VDADVIDGVLNRAPKMRTTEQKRKVCVNLVALRTEDFRDRINSPKEELEPSEDDAWEWEWDPDFVKVPLHAIGASCYNELYSLDTFESYSRYADENDVANV
jgi:hypothetical protein